MNYSDLISAYKSKTGQEPTAQANRCVEWVAKVGSKFEGIGFRDGSNSKQPLPDCIFKTWAENCFPNDAELQEVCASYVRECYQSGLAEGRAIA